MCLRSTFKLTEPSSFFPLRIKEGVELTPSFCPSSLEARIESHFFLLSSFSAAQVFIFCSDIPCCFKSLWFMKWLDQSPSLLSELYSRVALLPPPSSRASSLSSPRMASPSTGFPTANTLPSPSWSGSSKRRDQQRSFLPSTLATPPKEMLCKTILNSGSMAMGSSLDFA